jgi:hypothetical protein
MEKSLDIGAALFAFGAAVFWFLSASGTVAPMLAYWGGTPPSDPFYSAIKSAAAMNSCAAVLSGISALLKVSSFIGARTSVHAEFSRTSRLQVCRRRGAHHATVLPRPESL